MATIIDLVNSLNAVASTDYTTRVPALTRTNITAVGNAIASYPAVKDEFLNLLVNKIALTMVKQKMMKNRLGFLKRNNITHGDTIEEVFVDLVQAKQYDKNATDVFTKELPNVKVMFHRQDRQLQYTVTITDEQLRKAFLSEQNLSSFLDNIVNSLYSSKVYDEFVMTKELLGTYDGAEVQVDKIIDQATALAFLTKVKQVIRNFEFPSTTYNKQGVKSFTEKPNQILLINKDVMSVIEQHLGGVFNLKTVVPDVEIIEVDDFGTKAGRYAMLLDKQESGMIFDYLESSESIRNPKGLYTNVFLNKWSCFSLSHFSNICSFQMKSAG